MGNGDIRIHFPNPRIFRRSARFSLTHLGHRIGIVLEHLQHALRVQARAAREERLVVGAGGESGGGAADTAARGIEIGKWAAEGPPGRRLPGGGGRGGAEEDARRHGRSRRARIGNLLWRMARAKGEGVDGPRSFTPEKHDRADWSDAASGPRLSLTLALALAYFAPIQRLINDNDGRCMGCVVSARRVAVVDRWPLRVARPALHSNGNGQTGR